jgi:predicted DNA-binding transcriptional regulator AlpA
MSEPQSKTDVRSVRREPLLIKADEVAHLIAISTRTLWRLVSTGQFPRPVQFGRSTRWRVADVEEWIKSRSSDQRGSTLMDQEHGSPRRPDKL